VQLLNKSSLHTNLCEVVPPPLLPSPSLTNRASLHRSIVKAPTTGKAARVRKPLFTPIANTVDGLTMAAFAWLFFWNDLSPYCLQSKLLTRTRHQQKANPDFSTRTTDNRRVAVIRCSYGNSHLSQTELF
jgi:hypothetical protein